MTGAAGDSRDSIERVDAFVISIPRDTPYLGPLAPDEAINARGYFVRKGNRSIYPTSDQSVLIKATSKHGAVGWGESYALCAPGAILAIVDELLAPCVVGRDPFDVEVIHEDLYDMMRVRGFGSGFYADALAGLDIALWDLKARLIGQPLCKLLGGQRRASIPAYISGLPKPSIRARCELAQEFSSQGYSAFKFAAAISREGVAEEAEALRATLGPSADLMVDLHWMYTADEAVALIARMAAAHLYFVEAPCQPEDIEGLASVSARSSTPVAGGEEWHNVFEARPRLTARCVSIVQPEMAHTGVTQFMRIGRLAEAFHCRVIPHASVGVGIFQAASLHAAAALLNLPYHEYQHSVFDRNLRFIDGDMACHGGFFHVPTGPGLGVVPRADVFRFQREQ